MALFSVSLLLIIFAEAERDCATSRCERILLRVTFSPHDKLDASILDDRHYVIVINVICQGKIVSSAEFLFPTDVYL